MNRFIVLSWLLLLAVSVKGQTKVGGSASNAALSQKANLSGGNSYTGNQSIAGNVGVGTTAGPKYRITVAGAILNQPFSFSASPTVSDVPSGSAVFGTVAGSSNAGFFYNDGTTVRDLLAEKATARQVYYNTNVSGSLTIDASLYRDVFITLTGNVTSFSLINMTMGQSVYLRVEQGGAGGYTITFPVTFRFPAGADVDWHTTAGNANTFSFIPYSTTNADAFYTKQ